MEISSNTYNILASLFKHIFYENEFAPRGYTLIKGAYLQWRRGRGARGAMAPPIVETRRKIVNVVGNCRKIVNVVGNCQSCRREGGWLKILNVVRKNFWFVGKNFRFVGKVLPLPPPPQKKTWVPRAHGATAYLIILLF